MRVSLLMAAVCVNEIALSGMGGGLFKTASVIPDGLFGLAFADGTASYFMLEIDRGTMPVVRKGTNRTSFARKLKTYYEGCVYKRPAPTRGLHISPPWLC